MTNRTHSRSKDYDRIRKGYSAPVIQKIFGSCSKREQFLDVGTGTGILAFKLLAQFKKGVGIDPSEDRLREAEVLRTRNRLQKKIEFKIASAEKLPFQDESFDLITVAQAFHWLDHERALREFERVLRPKGTLAILWKYPNAKSTLSRIANRIVPELRRRDMKQQLIDSCDPESFFKAGFTAPKLWTHTTHARYSGQDWAKSVTWAAGAGSGKMNAIAEEDYLSKLIQSLRKVSCHGVWEPFINYLFISKKK